MLQVDEHFIWDGPLSVQGEIFDTYHSVEIRFSLSMYSAHNAASPPRTFFSSIW